jgi:hypothetical protein
MGGRPARLWTRISRINTNFHGPSAPEFWILNPEFFRIFQRAEAIYHKTSTSEQKDDSKLFTLKTEKERIATTTI